MLVRAVLLALTLVGFPGAAATQEAQRVGFAEDLDKKLSDFVRSDASGVYELEVTRGTLDGFLRIEFRKIELAAGASLSVTDRRGTEIQRIEGPIARATPLHSNVIFGNFAAVRVEGATAPSTSVDIGKVYYEYQFVRQNNIFDTDDRVLISDESVPVPIRELADSVVFLSFIRGTEYKVCTGFYLGGEHVLTNEHCVPDDDVCGTAVLVTGYALDDFGRPVFDRQFQCQEVVAADHALDYSVVRIEAGNDLGMTPLPLLETDPSAAHPAVLVQHPAGEPKQMASRGCTIIELPVAGRAEDLDFSHRCDTLGGSSGSPVIVAVAGSDGTETHCVAGLHHFGFTDAGEFQTFNRAVRASLLTASLAQAGVSFKTCN